MKKMEEIVTTLIWRGEIWSPVGKGGDGRSSDGQIRAAWRDNLNPVVVTYDLLRYFVTGIIFSWIGQINKPPNWPMYITISFWSNWFHSRWPEPVRRQLLRQWWSNWKSLEWEPWFFCGVELWSPLVLLCRYSLSCIGTFEATASSTAGKQTWTMAEAVMVKLEELGVGAWLAQGDRVIRFGFPPFVLRFVNSLVICLTDPMRLCHYVKSFIVLDCAMWCLFVPWSAKLCVNVPKANPG